MFRIRPDANPVGFGFRVDQPDEIPGFRMNADGSVRRTVPGTSTALNLLNDPREARETIPVSCTSDGSTFSCTTPRGRSFSNVPAPAKFPERIAPGVQNYHEYGVLSAPGGSGEKLMQGVIDKPTPGPGTLNQPATSQGTSNEATPGLAYGAFLGGSRLPWGSPLSPVKSYLWKDADGKPIVVNVTEPGHGLAPGYVVHYIVETPEGPRIQTEGEGLSPWQAPGSPEWLRKQLSDDTWTPYQQRILDQSK
jgi:hypothetical protein